MTGPVIYGLLGDGALLVRKFFPCENKHPFSATLISHNIMFNATPLLNYWKTSR